MDILALDEYGIPNVGAGESPHEMWKGRMFTDQNTVRETLGKFALYNNFILKRIKSNKRVVIAKWR